VVNHIVLFKLRDTSPENSGKVRGVLAGMAGKIPQLRHLEVGVNILQSERSYDLALVARFDSVDDLQVYQNHPVHVEVVKYMQEARQEVVVVDYEAP
jgi:Stress responsive A/B Barrel Domain